MDIGVGLFISCTLALGALYELCRYKNRRRYNNNNYIIFYDNFGNYHILYLYLNNINQNNTQDTIDNNTKEYAAEIDMNICSISLENITKGTIVRELNCGHYFKKKFIDIWLLENNDCPMCRKSFKS